MWFFGGFLLGSFESEAKGKSPKGAPPTGQQAHLANSLGLLPANSILATLVISFFDFEHVPWITGSHFDWGDKKGEGSASLCAFPPYQ